MMMSHYQQTKCLLISYDKNQQDFLMEVQTHNENMVKTTTLAKEWLNELKEMHGPLMLYQSGGCCERSAPLCMKYGEFKLGNIRSLF